MADRKRVLFLCFNRQLGGWLAAERLRDEELEFVVAEPAHHQTAWAQVGRSVRWYGAPALGTNFKVPTHFVLPEKSEEEVGGGVSPGVSITPDSACIKSARGGRP